MKNSFRDSKETMFQVCGILNFVEDGKHDFGQGLITYASGEIVNWLTTLSDTYRCDHFSINCCLKIALALENAAMQVFNEDIASSSSITINATNM